MVGETQGDGVMNNGTEAVVGKTGILLLHGFAGDPDEVRPLYDFLQARGYLVACPLLSGHGKTKRELSKTTFGDWIDSAERAYLELAEKCENVVAIGFSMGGLLAMNLWNYGFAGIVTINMPVYYWNPKVIVANLIKDFGQYKRKYIQVSTDKSISSMIEFQKLLTKTKPMFSNITCRALIIQALDDDTVHYKSADYIFHKICADKLIYKVPHGGHMVLHSESGEAVCKEIERFLQTC